MTKKESAIWFLFTEHFNSKWIKNAIPITLLPMRRHLVEIIELIDRRLEQFNE